MKAIPATSSEKALIGRLVKKYEDNILPFERLALALHTLFQKNDVLPPFIHSMIWRVKDPTHLRDKLFRKLKRAKAKNVPFDYTVENLFLKVNDLAGIRILHLHTSQISQIDQRIRQLLAEEEYEIVEGPFASTWDDEYRSLFEGFNIETRKSEEMYTSVHYVVKTGSLTAEIQVRTLAEELWGQVAHTINYPHPSKSIACREQIKVLARITSACTRAVDAIFRVHASEAKGALKAKSKAKSSSTPPGTESRTKKNSKRKGK